MIVPNAPLWVVLVPVAIAMFPLGHSIVVAVRRYKQKKREEHVRVGW
jgi:hypothetical protein